MLEPKVRAKARDLVAAITPGRTDLVPALTYPLPAYMIFTLIGFPDQDMDMLKSWCGNRMAFSWGRPGPDEQAEIAANMVRYWRYCEDFVAQRAREPRDDFTSDLIRVHLADPAALSLEEITNIAYGLSFAGHETTTNLTGNTLLRLLGDRAVWDELCASPQAIPGAIEEVLRYDTSVITWRRVTTRPTAIGQVEIPAGAKVLLLLGSAGRDPGRFGEPETFDIHRRDARAHLAFGKGIHYCFGAPLARMEARIVLELLTSQAPGLRLSAGPAPDFPANICFRGPRQLWVDWPGGTPGRAADRQTAQRPLDIGASRCSPGS